MTIFLQQEDGYASPEDPAARELGAWNVHIETYSVEALFEEFSQRKDVKITRGLCRHEYGALGFEVMDPNGYVLIFAQPDESNGSAADGNSSSSVPEATPRA